MKKKMEYKFIISDKSFFQPLKVSSKFPICNLPLRLDSYNSCDFNCKYCFSNNRQIGVRRKESKPNIKWLHNKFVKVYDDKIVDKSNFLEVLLSEKYTLHGGGQSDCFQYIEKEKQYTKQLVELCNLYEQSILFSTKSDSYYSVDVNPNLHSFQLSITNTYNHPVESNVASFIKRYNFYNQLIDEGFKVGVRVQPFIPNVSDVENIITLFGDTVSHITLETVKLVPGNKWNKCLCECLGLNMKDFTNMGLLNLKPELRLEYYNSIIDLLNDNGISFSIADNDLHYLGDNFCCCGDELIDKGTSFANTSMIRKYGCDYSINDIFNEASNVLECNCSSLYNSSRRNGCKTVKDFYSDRFDRSSAIFSPKFQYQKDNLQTKLI